MLYLKLFHGRTDPTKQMDDWGADGPIFGPYNYIHTTYANHLKMGLDGDAVHKLYVMEDMIYYNGVYYGDWSVFPEQILEKQNLNLQQIYDKQKAQLPERKNGVGAVDGTFPVKIIVYIRGGLCQEIKTNLPHASWEYALVDYDNDPDLPDDYLPFTKTERSILPSMATVCDLISSAGRVIENWESGDLAGAVRQMAAILAQIEPVPQDEQNRYTVFGYRTDHKCPFASWAAACTADEAKAVIGQQQSAVVVVCGVVKGWARLD